MVFNRTEETPGDGNLAANAKGRVYSMDAQPPAGDDPEEIEVAGLRKCLHVAVTLCTLWLSPQEADPLPEIQSPSSTVRILDDRKRRRF